jgi:hypothetical protein
MSFNRYRHGLFFSLLLTASFGAALGACGSSQPSTGSGGSGGSTTASTTGTGGSSTTTGTTTGSGGGSFACGAALSCDPGQACIVDDFDEPCSAAPDDGGACATGEHMSQCGGIGYPCCCGQAPPSTYHCVPLPDCDGGPSCACLGMVCPGDKWCQGIGSSTTEYHCVTPPVP